MKVFFFLFIMSLFLPACDNKREASFFTSRAHSVKERKLIISGRTQGLRGKVKFKLIIIKKDNGTKPEEISFELDSESLAEDKSFLLMESLIVDKFSYQLELLSFPEEMTCTLSSSGVVMSIEKGFKIKDILLTCQDKTPAIPVQIVCARDAYLKDEKCEKLSTLKDPLSCLAALDDKQAKKFIWSGTQCQVAETCAAGYFRLSKENKRCIKVSELKERRQCLSATTDGSNSANLFWDGVSCRSEQQCARSYYLNAANKRCTLLASEKDKCLTARISQEKLAQTSGKLFWLGPVQKCSIQVRNCDHNYYLLPQENECKILSVLNKDQCLKATTNGSLNAQLYWLGATKKCKRKALCQGAYYRLSGQRECKSLSEIKDSTTCLDASQDGSNKIFFWLGSGDSYKCKDPTASTFSYDCQSNLYLAENSNQCEAISQLNTAEKCNAASTGIRRLLSNGEVERIAAGLFWNGKNCSKEINCAAGYYLDVQNTCKSLSNLDTAKKCIDEELSLDVNAKPLYWLGPIRKCQTSERCDPDYYRGKRDRECKLATDLIDLQCTEASSDGSTPVSPSFFWSGRSCSVYSSSSRCEENYICQYTFLRQEEQKKFKYEKYRITLQSGYSYSSEEYEKGLTSYQGKREEVCFSIGGTLNSNKQCIFTELETAKTGCLEDLLCEGVTKYHQYGMDLIFLSFHTGPQKSEIKVQAGYTLYPKELGRRCIEATSYIQVK